MNKIKEKTSTDINRKEKIHVFVHFFICKTQKNQHFLKKKQIFIDKICSFMYNLVHMEICSKMTFNAKINLVEESKQTAAF